MLCTPMSTKASSSASVTSVVTIVGPSLYARMKRVTRSSTIWPGRDAWQSLDTSRASRPRRKANEGAI